MALTIQTNFASLSAQRNLEQASSDLNTSFQRLSSGLRINSAKDDAAGLAIANGLTSEIRGLNVAQRNANDGISVAQTAEGAYDEITNNLQRIRELAVQSSNSSNTDADRAKIQIEVAERISEIDRIANTINFNGRNLLDGSFGTKSFQVGTQAGQSIDLALSSAKTKDLGATTASQSGEYKLAKKTSTAGSLTTTGTLETLAAGQLTINGTSIRAVDTGDDTTSYSDNGASAIARAAAINASAGDTGVHAVANATTLALGTVTLAAGSATGAGDFQINNVDVDLTDTNTLATIVSDINALSASTGVSAAASGGAVTLTAVDGRNITVTSDGGAANATFANHDVSTSLDQTVAGTVTLYSNDDIVIGGTDPENVGSGLGTQTISANTEKVLQTENGASTFEDLATGDLIINGYSVNMSAKATTTANERSSVDAAASAMNIALQINNTTGLKDEVVADAQTVMNLGKVSAAAADASFQLIVNGTTVTIDQAILENDSNGYLQAEINAALNQGSTTDDITGIVASVNSDGELLLTADDGRNIVADVATSNENATDFLANFDATDADTDKVAKGSITLTAKDGYSVGSIEGEKQALAGIVSELGTVNQIDVSTYDGSQSALTTVDTALDSILSDRATLGAAQGRLESTIAVNSIVKENLSTARSRVQDTDFASETAKLTSSQILQQVSASVLAQANASQQIALSLLQ